MLKFKLLSSFFLLLILQIGYSQNPTSKKSIDSLFFALKVKPNSTDKVDNLISLYKKSVKSRLIDEAIIDEAILVSEKIFYLKGLGESYDRKGLTSRKNYNYSGSVNYHKRALNYLKKTTDSILIIKCLNNLGVTHRKLNLEKEAFDYYFQALDLSEIINHNRSITIALNGIGNVFVDTKEYDKALHYFKRVYALDLKSENIRGQEYSLSNIGEAYLYMKSFDSADHYLNKALALTKEYNHKSSEAIRYNLLGLLYQKKGEYNKSTNYYKEAIPLFTKSNSVRYLSNTLINIGENQLNLGKYDEAYENINVGLKSAKAIKSKENISLGYNALVNYFTLTKNYKEALNSHIIAKSIYDSIVNESTQRSIVSTQIAYETAQKDKKIQQLANEKEVSLSLANTSFNRLIVISAIGVFVILILSYLLYLYRRNSDLELENKNSELQNYVHQIKELKDKVNSKDLLKNQVLSESFNDFGLSKREIEVFKHLSSGFSNEEIAEKMFVSKNTIKTHIKNIYSKLDVKNRIQAMKKVNSNS